MGKDGMVVKQKETGVAMAARSQMRSGSCHPFGSLRGYVPLGSGEERIYHQIREAVPVLDAAVGKLVRLTGGFTIVCPSEAATARVNEFLRTVNCGRGQRGIHAFLAAYLDSLLTYGRAVGEMVMAGRRIAGVCWGDVTALSIREEDSGMDVTLCMMDGSGQMKPLPRQELLLFTTMNPEPEHPYGVSLLRGMPYLAEVLMKIYHTIGVNWERAGNVRYSVVCKPGEELDPVSAQEQSRQIAAEWARAMEDGKNGMVRDFVAVGDVEIKVVGSENPVLDSQTPVRQILEQLIAKTGLPPFLLGMSWSSTERMSAQQADLLTSELWAIRRAVEPVIEKICRKFLALEGYEPRMEIVWEEISLQDLTEQAKAEYYRAQARKLEQETDNREGT